MYVAKRDLDAYRSSLGQHAEPWIAESYPDRLTGYDVVMSIRKWLHEQESAHLSVCEAIMQKGNSWDLLGGRPPRVRGAPVGPAGAFISHMQAEHPFDTLLLMRKVHRGQAGTSPYPYQWVDYFTLRQCSPDFHPTEVARAVSLIGSTAVNFNREGSIWDRSFCVLETYATVQAGGFLYVRSSKVHEDFHMMGCNMYCCDSCNVPTIDAANATTHNVADKQRIDEFISVNVGFPLLNETMTRELKRGLRREDARSCVYVALGPLITCVCCVPCVEERCPGWVPWFIASP